MLKYFKIPFAQSGTRTAVPNAVDPSGFVSYTEGYGADYQRQKTDPLSKNIERDKMNELFFDATNAIGEIQGQGVPDFISTALNGGSPFSYPINALVRYTDNNVYSSLVATNTALPTDPTKWVPLNDATFTKFPGNLNYVLGTIGQKLQDLGANPRSLGAPSNGVASDNAFIAAALLLSKTLDLRNRTWLIDGTGISLPSGCVVDMRGATIIANCGANPIFSCLAAPDGITIEASGSPAVTGTAASFLLLQGTTNIPTTPSQYARQIRVRGVHVSSTTIGKFIDGQLASRQLFVDSCQAFTANGLDQNGKHVEWNFTKCVLFSSTGAAGTYGIRQRSPGGTTFVNEGTHFTDCTIDNFEKAFDTTDIFTLTVTSGYIGCLSSGYILDAGQPTSNLCTDIKFVNVPMTGRIRFKPTGGRDYAATFTGCTTLGGTGAIIELAADASGITIRDHKFRASTSGVALVMQANNANCVVDGIDCDSTYAGGVQVKGTVGAGVDVNNIAYAGSGDALYIERQIRIRGVPVYSSAIAAFKQTFNPSSIQGSRAVGVVMATQTNNFAKGETGEICIEISYSGANATTQRFDVAKPANMIIPGGSGWGAEFIMTGAASGRLSYRIPYYCTADITAGVVSITNAVGNTVAVDFHSWFGIVRDW